MGVDPAVRETGIGIIQGNKVLHTLVIKPSKQYKDLGKKLAYIYTSSYAIARDFKVEILAVESTFLGISPKVSGMLNQVQGIYSLLAANLGMKHYAVSPMKIKKMFSLTKESKEDVMKCVNKIFESDFTNHNITDALAMALYYQSTCINL